MARHAGRATSPAKAAAARNNGAKADARAEAGSRKARLPSFTGDGSVLHPTHSLTLAPLASCIITLLIMSPTVRELR